jgi:hypothetical protein
LPYAARKALVGAAVVGVAAAFVALNLSSASYPDNPLPVVCGKLWHLLLFLVFWFAVYALGRGATRVLFGPRWGSPDLACALGVVAVVAALFALCAVGLAYGWLVKALVVGGAGAGAFVLKGELGRVPERLRRGLGEMEVTTALLIAGTAGLVLPVALTTPAPPFFWDALTYHLAVPKAYADAHGFVYLPYNVYASMPMGGSLFYLGPYLWDGLITARASHLVVTVLALAVTYRLGRLWLKQFYAALAAVLVLFTPPVVATMCGAHNDHFQLLFVVAALYVYFGKESESAPARRSWLAVGIFLGAALAVKYAAVAALAAFAPIWIYDAIRKRVRWSWLARTAAVAALVVLPWLAKAYVERGNPVFPVMYDVFDGRDFTAEQSERLTAWQLEMGKGHGITDLLWLPYRISVEADVGYESFSGVYLPFLLPFAALALFLFRRGGRLIAFGWLYLAAWFFGPQQLRFLDAALPALAVAATAVVGVVEAGWGDWARRGWRLGVTAVLFPVSVPYFAGGLVGFLPVAPYLAGTDARTFLVKNVGFAEAQEFINENLPADAKILMVFMNHTLYLEREAVYDSFLEASPFLMAAEKARGGGELYALARRWGVTHVHVHHAYEDNVWPYYSPRACVNFYDFLGRFGRVVYEDDGNEVFALEGRRR